jgi:HEAT repeat protein
MRGSPGQKQNACRQLIRFGRPAVEFLAYAAIQDSNLSVREVCIGALGAVGAAARDQCPQLLSIVTRPNPYESTIMDRKTMDLAAQWDDVRRAAKAAAGRIGCN